LLWPNGSNNHRNNYGWGKQPCQEREVFCPRGRMWDYWPGLLLPNGSNNHHNNYGWGQQPCQGREVFCPRGRMWD
jgi:hypothetical protein